MASETGTGRTEPLQCPNCGAAAVDRFCPACGQRQGELMPSVRDWLREFVSEGLVLDAKLPRTIRRLIWPPGALSVAWREGKRTSFVRPLRLYLGLAMILFVAWPHTMFHDFVEGLIHGMMATDEVVGDPAAEELAKRSMEVIVAYLPSLLLIVLVPLFSGLLGIADRFRTRFVENLVVALHVHCIVFMAVCLTIPLDVIPIVGDVVAIIVIIFTPVYLTLCVARYYDVSVIAALARTLFVGITYGLLSSIALTVVLALAT